MGNIHVNHSLDPDQQIFHYMNFHDLVDLLKFNQAFFARADRPQRQGLLNTPGKWHYLVEDSPPAPKGKGKTRPTPKLLHNLDADAITLQSWLVAEAGAPALWNDADSQQPRVCIVSSIRALSESLFTDEATSVFIEQASHSGVARAAAAHGPARHKKTEVSSVINPDNLCAIAISRRAGTHANLSPAGTHLRVDLGTLLAGVIVPPTASERYMELITRLVQESVWVTVTRASPPVAASKVSKLVGNLTPARPAAVLISNAERLTVVGRRSD